MKLNKKSKEYTISDLREWSVIDKEDLNRLILLHALLDKITSSMSKDPTKIHAVAPFKQLKFEVKNQINTLQHNQQKNLESFYQADANLV